MMFQTCMTISYNMEHKGLEHNDDRISILDL